MLIYGRSSNFTQIEQKLQLGSLKHWKFNFLKIYIALERAETSSVLVKHNYLSLWYLYSNDLTSDFKIMIRHSGSHHDFIFLYILLVIYLFERYPGRFLSMITLSTNTQFSSCRLICGKYETRISTGGG